MRRVLVPHDIARLAPEVDASVQMLSGPTMGTSWSVKLVAPDERALETVQDGIAGHLDKIVRQMSTWEPDSVVSRYNAAPAGTWHRVPAAFLFVLCFALDVARDSDGAFDPTSGPSVNAWGFGPDPQCGQLPSPEDLEAAVARVGWQKVRVDRKNRRVFQPGGVYLDFSAIAKGFAVDLISRYLEGSGLENHLVEVGGELRGAGIKPDAMPWWVELEHPPALPAAPATPLVQNVVALHGLSVATSGDYRRYFDDAGTRYSHTIDPRTGEPVRHRVASVTVIHRDCITADAASTAINVLGPDDGLEWANRRNIPALFVLRTDDGFAERTSTQFEALVE